MYQFYRANKQIITKILLYLVSVITVLYFFPSQTKFKYDLKRGSIWNYENLYSPFDFPISKTQDEINQLEKEESINLGLDGGLELDLLLNQVEILFGQIEGKQVASNDTFTIALDISINNDLLAEGVSREFINKIQNERKDIKLEFTDKIEIYIHNKSHEIITFLLKHKEFICNETQALDLFVEDNIVNSKLMDIDVASSKVDSTEIKFKIKKIK